MKNYVTTKVLWRSGVKVPVGTTLALSDAEAKYIKHALQPVEVEAPQSIQAPSAPEPSHDGQPEAPAYGATVQEPPRHHRTTRRRLSREGLRGDDHA